MAFPTIANPADRCCRLTPRSPFPGQEWHGIRVTNAYHEEVRVSADVCASATNDCQWLLASLLCYGSTTVGWYPGVAVLYVVREARVFD
jgi:hypothetical protein